MWVVVRSSSPSLRSSTGICPRTSPQVGQETVTVWPQKPNEARSTVSSPRRVSPIHTLAKRRHVKGLGVAGVVVRIWPPAFAFARPRRTRHVHAERHLAKAGVARRKGRGLPTGAERRRPKAGLHKRSAEDWGYPCAARPGQSPLAQGLSAVLDREADGYRVGVAGRKGPLRWVAEDGAASRRQGGNVLPMKDSQHVR